MTQKPRLKVAGHELDFAAISFKAIGFKAIGEQIAKSLECEERGYHVAVEPSQAKVQRVGDKNLSVDLCRDCGIWTLADRFDAQERQRLDRSQ